jgi:hypothetical protein
MEQPDYSTWSEDELVSLMSRAIDLDTYMAAADELRRRITTLDATNITFSSVAAKPGTFTFLDPRKRYTVHIAPDGSGELIEHAPETPDQ